MIDVDEIFDEDMEIDFTLTDEDIEILKEAERQRERGEGIELKEGMTLLDLIKDWREQDKQQ